MKEQLVSIIILAYNNLQYIEDCLKSVFLQDYPNIEIVFCDDSSDNFKEKEIGKYIEENKRDNIVNYLVNSNESNLGIVKNINTGIRLSKGDILVHIAVDDGFFDESVISEIVKFHNRGEYLIAVGYLAYHDETLTKWEGYTPLPKNISLINGTAAECYKTLSQWGSFFPSPGLSYQRKLIDLYGYYDEEYVLVDDFSRFLNLTRRGCRIGFLDKFLVKHRKGGISTAEEKTNRVKELLKMDMDKITEKEIIPYKNKSINSNNCTIKNESQVSIDISTVFNQRTVFNGEGKVLIGKDTIFGDDLDPHFVGFYIIIQARNEDAIIRIGDNTIFSNDITIIAMDSIDIGKDCIIGDRVTILDCDFHNINPINRRESNGKHEKVVIDNNVWIGTGVTILKGVTIGENTVVTANSVVTKDVPSDSIVGGNPAKVLGKIC